ncbi:hypothetical protein BCR42DRAFT_412934 [Absidia repens]|uniref:Uncharacterized protein n=1 Tax=Absidia repens TaxID=90262 RepID=A0A1X2IKC4_9FUNG|nr:hypothetical protein BCR42DRAFT_412934 [Absidia repens]
MTDFLYMISHAKLAEYYETRTDLPMRKYVLIANMLRNTPVQDEGKTEEQWLDTCLDALDQQDDEMYDDTKKQAITVRHYSFEPQEYHQNQSSTSKSISNQQQGVNIYQVVLS